MVIRPQIDRAPSPLFGATIGSSWILRMDHPLGWKKPPPVVRRCAASYKAVGTVTEGSATNVPWPTHVAGDYAILVVVHASTVSRGATSPATLSVDGGFTAVSGGTIGKSIFPSFGTVRITTFENRATSASMTSPQVSNPGGGFVVMSYIITFDGTVASGSAVDVVSTADGTTTSVSIAGADPTESNTTVLVAYGACVGSSATIGSWTNADLSSITERVDSFGSASTHTAGATGEKITDTAYGATTATSTAVTCWVGVTIALKSEPSVPGDAGGPSRPRIVSPPVTDPRRAMARAPQPVFNRVVRSEMYQPDGYRPDLVRASHGFGYLRDTQGRRGTAILNPIAAPPDLRKRQDAKPIRHRGQPRHNQPWQPTAFDVVPELVLPLGEPGSDVHFNAVISGGPFPQNSGTFQIRCFFSVDGITNAIYDDYLGTDGWSATGWTNLGGGWWSNTYTVASVTVPDTLNMRIQYIGMLYTSHSLAVGTNAPATPLPNTTEAQGAGGGFGVFIF